MLDVSWELRAVRGALDVRAVPPVPLGQVGRPPVRVDEPSLRHVRFPRVDRFVIPVEVVHLQLKTPSGSSAKTTRLPRDRRKAHDVGGD